MSNEQDIRLLQRNFEELQTRIKRLEDFIVRDARDWEDTTMLNESSLRTEVGAIVNADVAVYASLSVDDN